MAEVLLALGRREQTEALLAAEDALGRVVRRVGRQMQRPGERLIV